MWMTPAAASHPVTYSIHTFSMRATTFQAWASSYKMRSSVVKTKEMVCSFSRSLELAPVSIENKLLREVVQSKLLARGHAVFEPVMECTY